eukprot:scaffold274429_cov24-Prasinocladus_malaysianus.AAC.1
MRQSCSGPLIIVFSLVLPRDIDTLTKAFRCLVAGRRNKSRRRVAERRRQRRRGGCLRLPKLRLLARADHAETERRRVKQPGQLVQVNPEEHRQPVAHPPAASDALRPPGELGRHQADATQPAELVVHSVSPAVQPGEALRAWQRPAGGTRVQRPAVGCHAGDSAARVGACGAQSAPAGDRL